MTKFAIIRGKLRSFPGPMSILEWAQADVIIEMESSKTFAVQKDRGGSHGTVLSSDKAFTLLAKYRRDL